jgi:hypothetical protein
MRSRRRPVINLFGLLLVFPLALGASCSVLGIDSYDDERERLEAARDAWEARNVDSYSYVLRRICFCAGATQPARVVVQDGQKVSVTLVETGEPVSQAELEFFLTIDELFDFIQDAIDREAHRIDVTYDPDRGIPLTISIDYEELAVDEEMAFEVSQFEPAGP